MHRLTRLCLASCLGKHPGRFSRQTILRRSSSQMALLSDESTGFLMIGLYGASNFATERLGVGDRNVLHGVSNRDFYGHGSILRVNIDSSHPLAWGMEKDVAIWFEQSPSFSPSFEAAAGDVVNVASYP